MRRRTNIPVKRATQLPQQQFSIKNQTPVRKQNFDVNPVTGKISAPEFPGQTMGMTMQQAKELYQNSVRSKGFSFSGGTSSSPNQIDIPGDARMLLGLACLDASFGTCTLKVNQTDVIEDTDTGFLKIGDNKDFYRLELPLTGNDTIKLILAGAASYTNKAFIFFFI